MTFIKNDLSYVPKDRFVVFCQHIPLVHTENIEDLKTLLNGRNKLFALSGHTHRVSRHFIPIGNAVMQELVAGATCGHWWVGEKDWLGVPSALMQCGAPRNYFTIEYFLLMIIRYILKELVWILKGKWIYGCKVAIQ